MHDIIIDLIDSLSAVKDLSELNCQADSEEQLIKEVLTILIHKRDMERCSFFLLNESGYLISVAGLSFNELSNDSSSNYKSLQFKVGEGIIGVTAQTGEIQNCQNCWEDERFSTDDGQNKTTLPGSIICVPVFVTADELVGVLNVSHPETYHFTEWHIRMLDIYKNMLGQLMTNYRLFQEMETRILTRTLKLETSLAEIQGLKDHYQNISMLDPLTGLHNRRYFYEHVGVAIAKTKRYGESICLLMLDLDHFKAVNDKFGHIFGDEVLIKVAEVLQSIIRESDVLARFGGEEFIIVFSNTNCNDSELFAERIRKKIESIVWRKQQGFSQTISIGLYYVGNKNGETGKEMDIDIGRLVHYADTALYYAKESGRNTVVRFTEDMLEK